MRTPFAFLFGGILAVNCLAANAVNPLMAAPATEVGSPVTIPHARYFDLTAKSNGRVYRVYISTPAQMEPGRKFPVFYVLDANWYFATVANTVTEAAGAKEISPAIVVGLGYPTEDNDEVNRRRVFELTHSIVPMPDRQSGGGDKFLQFLTDEVKPFVAARYPVDPAHQIIFGKSLGGLAVLRLMFRQPDTFDSYIASSPAISWNHRDVLDDEVAFVQRVKGRNLHLKLQISSAENEQYHGPDPKRLAAANQSRMVDNARELAGRLTQAAPENLTVNYVIFPGETHVSVSDAALGRALVFGLGRPK